MRNQSGFTLVDIMISTAIFSIIMLMICMEQVHQSQMTFRTGLQTEGRIVMTEIAHSVTENAAAFPPMDDGNGAQVVYVGCFNEDGSSKTNATTGNQDFAPISPGALGIEALRVPLQDGAGNFVCTQNVGGIEVHVTHDPADLNQVYVQTVILELQNGGTNARQFAVGANNYETQVSLGTRAPAAVVPNSSTAQLPEISF